MSAIPVPKDPRHQRFADLVLVGNTGLADAYKKVFPGVTHSAAKSLGCRLMKRPDVKAYLDALRQEQAAASHLTVSEILTFCARVVRTGIGDLDPSAESATGNLIKSHAANDGEMGSSSRVEKHDPFKAIEIHLKLSGDDPSTNVLRELSAAIGALGGTTLPTGKL